MNVKTILNRTIFGLSKEYYFRQFIFAILVCVAIILKFISDMHHADAGSIARISVISGVLLICSLLYPYSRFLYESIVGFFLGENTFLVNSWIFLVVKLFTMVICLQLSFILAPICWIYLYFYYAHHAKKQSKLENEIS
ncbi:hypothetical protein [Actinobacillus delphinicola]|uniref:Uncharacterized protein n=1 Tax=Actinobacillus delphinicola TaxID=51161 RepID=A0A448TVY0_9PAST|nr:hypothetical protein [Actinobacillus delphinicola]VEJ10079.1 Uncharacterised protein [Actinobacillus delphinicola]